MSFSGRRLVSWKEGVPNDSCLFLAWKDTIVAVLTRSRQRSLG
jgi:hypothetical protein